ncbi:MAG TPA: carboxy terminal-processing peptidase [Verrucomicrobia bacterium]|nr:carboxy terminal-processing peptidase [Verrucomicrobiota bacterium]
MKTIRLFQGSARILLLAFCSAALPLAAQTAEVRSSQALLQADDSAQTVTNPRSWRIEPGPDDGRIAFLTAFLLQEHHYTEEVFDDDVASRFLDRYLDSLDPYHLHFLKSDIEEFEKYRTTLDNLTLMRRTGVADTSPAYEIVARFMERLSQRVDYATEVLRKERFTFDTDERVKVDRRKEPYPENLDAARELWRQRLRLEYLQEKLALEGKKSAAKTNASNGAPEKSIHEQIVEKLIHRYNRNLKMFADWNHEDVMGAYLTALAHVYDPHSDYFNRPELESFRISMNLQLFGIGAELRSEDGYCRVERLLPGGPAIKSKKINPGDHIVAVAQGDEPPVDVVDMDLRKVVQLIRGPKGTEVRLTLQPGGDKSAEQVVVSLIRDEIPLDDQAAKGKIIDLPVDGKTVRLGVINLPSFYAPTEPGAPVAASEGGGREARHNTSTDVAKLLAKFKQEGVQGVILDLRMNGGGVLEEAVKVAGLFIPQGPIVQARDRDRGPLLNVQVYPDRDPTVAYDGPLVVLTSRFSASASEIVAGALQDYGRAIIVGDSSTHGKGTVQTVTSLRPLLRIPETDTNEPGALKFTIRKFYRASGASTQLKGVMPDIVLPSRWNYSTDIGESSLENPLKWDTIPSARYEKLDLVEKYLPELLKRSAERVATNRDFVYLREEIEEFRKMQEDKTVSLNEAERKKERERAEARAKARQEELRSRKDPDIKMYEITLKLAELPGLPPPMAKTNAVSRAEMALNGLLPEDDTDEPAVPEVDVHLEEAQRILVDYIGLLPKDKPLVLVN